jgi:hypothetical protein
MGCGRVTYDNPSTCLLGFFLLHQVSHEVEHAGWLKRTSFFQVEALLDGEKISVIFISSCRDAIVGIHVITKYIDVIARGTRLESRAGISICSKASANDWDALPVVMMGNRMNCSELWSVLMWSKRP